MTRHDDTLTQPHPFILWTGDRGNDKHTASLAFDVDAPAIVELVFPRHDGSDKVISFWLDRELLAAGLQHHASKGAVSVRPHSMDGWLVVTLPINGTACDFYAETKLLRDLLAATAELAPLEVAA